MCHPVVLQGVTKTFGRKAAVDRLDMVVPEGSIYGFIGPNGSGKTTTLRLILRIFQPDAGRVVVLGAENAKVADERLGYLPEERGLYKRMRVLDLLIYFARLKGFYDCRGAVEEWLERLGAASWANQKIDSLSKGMAQKIQFLVAVIARPRLLILDEPFAGLDPVNLDVMKQTIQSLCGEGVTVLFSTHDMHVAEQMCDRVCMICEGRNVLEGSLEDIKQRYPADRIRVRLSDGAPLPGDLPGVATATATRQGHELQLAEDGDPQSILGRLVQAVAVEHFDIVRPTLHDIFVQIATSTASD